MFGEITQALGKNFLVAYFVPSTLLAGVNLLLLPTSSVDRVWKASLEPVGVNASLLVLIVIALASLLLAQTNRLVTRAAEGYYGSLCWKMAIGVVPILIGLRLASVLPVRWTTLALVPVALAVLAGLHSAARQYHRWRYRRWCGAIERLKATDQYKARGQRRRLSRRYPLDDRLILPTRFGNVLRSFEHHPRYLYNIGPISGWARLVAVIPDAYRDALEEHAANVAFVLNMTLVLLLVGGELMVWRDRAPALFVALAAACLCAAYMTYLVACSAAEGWGEYVRGAFDLYRLDLLKQLHVHVPAEPITLDQERELWGHVDRLTFEIERTDEHLTFDGR